MDQLESSSRQQLLDYMKDSRSISLLPHTSLTFIYLGGFGSDSAIINLENKSDGPMCFNLDEFGLTAQVQAELSRDNFTVVANDYDRLV